jgi:hypothetical protein
VVLVVAGQAVTKQIPKRIPRTRPMRAVTAVDRTGLVKRGQNTGLAIGDRRAMRVTFLSVSVGR